MSIQLIQNRLESYACNSALAEEHAMREIAQEVVLSALGRTDFFKYAVFHGGTCLRIFYGLNRFSEDLDFCLSQKSSSFEITPFLAAIVEEVRAYGLNPEIQDRSRGDSAVRKAFIKDDSLGKILQFQFINRNQTIRKIKIKIEVDTSPPSGGQQEIKYLDFPFVSSVAVHDLPSLFAGKMHALLCRNYLKGRDWYDFIWYSSARTAINMNLLSAALDQIGPWAGQGIAVDSAWCKEALYKRITTIDWKAAADEVSPFVKQEELPSLNLWSRELFLAQLEKLFA